MDVCACAYAEVSMYLRVKAGVYRRMYVCVWLVMRGLQIHQILYP